MDVYRQVSKELSIPVDKVEDACKSMFTLIVKEMKSGEHRAIRLMHLGVFRCKPVRVAKLKEKGLI